MHVSNSADMAEKSSSKSYLEFFTFSNEFIFSKKRNKVESVKSSGEQF